MQIDFSTWATNGRELCRQRRRDEDEDEGIVNGRDDGLVNWKSIAINTVPISSLRIHYFLRDSFSWYRPFRWTIISAFMHCQLPGSCPHQEINSSSPPREKLLLVVNIDAICFPPQGLSHSILKRMFLLVSRRKLSTIGGCEPTRRQALTWLTLRFFRRKIVSTF